MTSIYKVILNFNSDPRLKLSLLYQIRLIIDPNEEYGENTQTLTEPQKEKILELVINFYDCIDGFVCVDVPFHATVNINLTYEGVGIPDSERTDEIEVWFDSDMMRKFMKECKCWIK